MLKGMFAAAFNSSWSLDSEPMKVRTIQHSHPVDIHPLLPQLQIQVAADESRLLRCPSPQVTPLVSARILERESSR